MRRPVAAVSGSADILNMEDARERRRKGDAAARHAHAGAHLAAAREAQGLPLSEAAERTHIKQSHLAAIEAVDTAGLPPRPYALGFVKAYAEFLGLEAAPIVARFKEDAGYAAPSVHPTAEKFQAAQDAAQPASREMSLWAMLAIVLFMIWCAWQIALPREAGPSDAADALLLTAPAPAATAAPPPVIDLVVIERVEPVYPRTCDAGARPVETVEVMFNVTALGRVAGEQVIRSSNTCFNDAALNAVRRWTFEPHRVGGAGGGDAATGAARAVYDQRRIFTFNQPS